jgi:ribonuclease HI/pterin-4a-carbinolamine dehydratase
MWQTQNNKLHKEFTFKDFKEAFQFMTQVSVVCEKKNHHPKWTNEWNKVEVWLSTHDAGDTVTDKDTELAATMDDIYEMFSEKGALNSVPKIKIYTDGGSRGNPGPAASGYVLFNGKDEIIESKGIYLGIATNNQAEYQALKYALEAAKKLKAKDLDIYMDSLLIVNQIKGVYKIKSPDLLPLHKAIKDLLETFDSFSFTHVPRALNSLADAEVNKALDAAAESA